MIRTIAARELRSLFFSPLAWIMLGLIQFILAWSFLGNIDTFFSLQSELLKIRNAPGVTDLVVAPLFEFARILMLMITPLITMRLISEESQSGSIQLLLSSPASMTQIILGKYAGAMTFMLCIIGLTSLMPLSLGFATPLDYGKLLAGILTLTLNTSAFVALGLFMSTLTRQPIIAAISSSGLLIFFWIMNAAGTTGAADANIFNQLSFTYHSLQMLRGIVYSADVIYFILFITGFLMLSIRQLENRRVQP